MNFRPFFLAAGLTTKSIFVQGMKNPVTYYSKKLVWSDGSGSDLFAILKAYKVILNVLNDFLNDFRKLIHFFSFFFSLKIVCRPMSIV